MTKKKYNTELQSLDYRRFRLSYLQENPICEICLVTDPDSPQLATELDHIEQRKDRPDLLMEISNVQALCHIHHKFKTLSETTTRLHIGFDIHGNPLDYRKTSWKILEVNKT